MRMCSCFVVFPMRYLQHLRANPSLRSGRQLPLCSSTIMSMCSCLAIFPDALPARALARFVASFWKTAAIEHWYNNEYLLMFSRLPDALPATPPGRSIASLWKTAVIAQQCNKEHLLMFSRLPDALPATSPGRSIAAHREDSRHCAAAQ